MSRVAKNPVVLPSGVEVTVQNGQVCVKGKNGNLSLSLPSCVSVDIRDNKELVFKPANQDKHSLSMSGTIRALCANMVKGVSEGFERKLQLIGVGYRAQAQGSVLNLSLGYSHPIVYQMPEGVSVQTPSQTEIIISGADKQKIGQVSAEIRAFRAPEPYKGKGVRYADEVVVMKEAKKK